MNVALLVFPIHYSHGCILQTFALYSFLKKNGCNVQILNRQPERYTRKELLKLFVKRFLKKLLRGYKGAIFYNGWFPSTIMREQQHFIGLFRQDIINVYSTDELRKYIEKGHFEVIVVGSDQTWRPSNVPSVLDYWLDFASDNNNIKKVAYAPSFGVDTWEYTEQQTQRCIYLASLFDAISVREKSGVLLCKKYLNCNATHVLDPTLLWSSDFYMNYASQSPMPKGECHCYFLDISNEKRLIAESVSKLKGLSLRYINTQTEDSNAPISKRIAPSIEKWLAGFLYGDYIVVDSFHAMVFSIIFQKPFIVIGNKRRGMSRFESLLDELGLANRIITDGTSLSSVIEEDIDWQSVTEKLSTLRERSIRFLHNVITQ